MKKRIVYGLLLTLMLVGALMLASCFGGNPDSEECEHQYGSLVAAKDATCTDEGNVAYYRCSKCQKYFDANKKEISSIKISAIGHDAEAAWTTEGGKHYHLCKNGCGTKFDESSCSGGTATCGESALCVVCGKSYMSPTGHNYSTLKYSSEGHWNECSCGARDNIMPHAPSSLVTAPTCTEQGYTKYTCECGYSYADDYTDAAGHTFEKELSKNDSYHWYKSTCEHTEEVDGYEPHKYTSKTVAPTCTEQGYTEHTCACGYSYKDEYKDATGHKVDLVEKSSNLIDPSSCTYAVTYGGVCETCGKPVTETKNIERHSFFEKVMTPATCQKDGEMGVFCSAADCKFNRAASETKSYSDPSAHTWEEASNVGGVIKYKCSQKDCTATKQKADTSASVSGDQLGNLGEVEFNSGTSVGIGDGIKDKFNGQDVEISAGELKDKEKENAIANSKLTDEEKALLGDNPIYDFTLKANGENKSELGGTATIKIPYTLKSGDDPNHVIVWYIKEGAVTAVAAVYSEDVDGNGYVTFETTHFSYYTVAMVSPTVICDNLGHDEFFTLVVEPTCSTSGYTICLRCGRKVEGSEVPAKGHNWQSTEVSKVSCSQNGITRYSCSDCNIGYEAVVPATGHYYVISEQITATCSSIGKVTYICAHCNDSYTVTTPQLSHTYFAITVNPTCTEQGYTEKTCTLCGDVIRTATVAPMGHSYDAVWHHDENGHYHTCVICGEQGSVTAHTPGAPATEIAPQICTVCERVLVPAVQHVHSFKEVPAKAPTCQEGGNIAYYVCSCDKWFADKNGNQLIPDHASVFLSAKGHTYETMPAVEPSCTESGYTEGLYCSECKTVLRGHIEIAAHGHDYMKTEKAPSCTKDGVVTFVCRHCGDNSKPSETIPALGHNYISSITAPTCDKEGYTIHNCARCGETKKDSVKPALGHAWSAEYSSNAAGHFKTCVRCKTSDASVPHTPDYPEATTEHGINCLKCGYVIAEAIDHVHQPKLTPAKNPSCEVAGNIAYYVCTCGDWFYDAACTNTIYNRASVVLPSTGHSAVFHNKQNATCLEIGYEAGYKCDVCDTWLSGHKEIPIADHDYNKAVTEPTCTAGGYTTYTCKVCKHSYTGNETQPIAHDYNTAVTAPTCTAGGYTTYTCKVCKHSYTGNETQPIAHDYNTAVTAPTCTAGGYTTYTCKVCKHSYTGNETQPIAHDYNTAVTEPTCTAGGYTTYTCKVCKHSYTGNETQPIAHDYNTAVTAPTCTAEGYTTYTCKVCGDSYTGNETEKAPHDYNKVVTEPTCTAGGYTTYTCAVCKYSYKDNETSPTGHKYDAVVTEPTCTKGGYTTYTCKACGDSYTDDETDPVEHDYNAVVTEPTCTAEGYTTYTCKVCGDSYTGNETEKAAHDYNAVVTEPTCTKGGYTTYTCKACGDSYTDDETDPVEHDYNAVVTEPTCTAGGYTTYTCKACGDSYTDDETDPVEHDYNAVVTEPTCTAGGYTTYTCKVCGDSYTDDETDLIAHDYNAVVTAPTCTAEGYTTYTCKACGDSYTDDETEKVLHKTTDDGDCTTPVLCERCGCVVIIGFEEHTYDNACSDLSCNNENCEFERSTDKLEPHTVNNEGICTVCGASYTCEHSYKEIDHLEPTCTTEGYTEIQCTLCGETKIESLGFAEHTDVNGDGLCDNCDESLLPVTPPTCSHRDADDDGKCDYCNKEYDDGTDNTELPTPDRTGKPYYWDEGEIIMQMNLSTSSNTLSAGQKRYMAGESGDTAKIDDLVKERNINAELETRVSVTYTYIEDADGINWNKYDEEIFNQNMSYVDGEIPDMYSGFAHDLSLVASMGVFRNLYYGATTEDNPENPTNYFTFLLSDYRPENDDEGYLIDFMKSLTPMSESKMYLYASNYTLDVIRAMYVIPVNVALLRTIDVCDLPEGLDMNGNYIYDINDFYDMIRCNEWTYDMLATLSAVIYNPTSGLAEPNINDILGFAVNTNTLTATNAFIYSQGINWYDSSIDQNGDYSYSMPEENYSAFEMVNALENLFSTTGVIYTTTQQENNDVGTTGAGMGIRTRFSENKMLFGGVVLLGNLEYSEYQNMENGFGIAPIPLYDSSVDGYTSVVDSVSRVIGINKNSSIERFAWCTAFLDYQALNSDEVVAQYYKSLQYDTVGGEEYNVEMLEYLRDCINTNNRYQYLDNLCHYAVSDAAGLTNQQRIGMIFRLGTSFSASNEKYMMAVGAKNTALQLLVDIYRELDSDIGGCKHEYNEISYTAPTCQTEGYRELQCTLCDKIRTESLGFAEHIDEDGDARCDICGFCNHIYEERNCYAPTCTTEGYRELQCTSCGEITTESLGFAEHMDEDGDSYCDNCNAELGSNEELEDYRNDIINRMHDEWSMIIAQYPIQPEQSEMFDDYIYRAENAVSMDELDVIFHKEFMLFISEIRDSVFEYVVEVTLDIGELEINVGDDINEFLQTNVVGKTLVVRMNTGKEYNIEITMDMLTVTGDSSVLGDSINVSVSYATGVTFNNHHIYIDVVADIESANLIGSYSANCIYNYMEGLDVTISLYDNGYATMSLAFGGEDQGTQYVTYTLENGIFTMIIDGGAALLCLDAEKGEFTTYIPEGNLIGTYTYADGDEVATFDVYGEYTGAKEYLAVFKMSSDEMGATITGYVYLDLENKLFNTYMFEDSNFSIDESGNLYCDHNYIEQYRNEATCQHEGQICYRCTNCRESIYETIPMQEHKYDDSGSCIWCGIYDDTSIDIESYRSEKLMNMANDWNYLAEKYNIADEYIAQYNELCERMEYASSIPEIDEIYNSCKMLVSELHTIYGKCEHVYHDIDYLDPTCTVEGYREYECTFCGIHIRESLGYAEHMDENGDAICENCGGEIGSGNIDQELENYRNDIISLIDNEWKILSSEFAIAADNIEAYYNIRSDIQSASSLDEIYSCKERFYSLTEAIRGNNGGEGCNHNYIESSRNDSTCVSQGYVEYICTICNVAMSEMLPLGDHVFGENGYCQNCDAREGEGYDVTTYRMQIISQISGEWANLVNTYFITSEQYSTFNQINDNINAASTIEEIDMYLMHFNNLARDIRSYNGNDCSHIDADGNTADYNGDKICDICGESIDAFVEDSVNYTEFNGEELVFYVGSDVIEFINKYIVGKTLTVHMNSGAIHVIEITSDMVSHSGMGEVLGEYIEFSINYNVGEYNMIYVMGVTATADMSSVNLIGSYGANCMYNYMEGLEVVIELYDNGYAIFKLVMGDEEATELGTYVLAGDVLTFTLDGEDYIYALPEGATELSVYRPSSALIGTYKYTEDSMELVFEVYGDSMGAGRYMAVISINDGAMSATVTSFVFLDTNVGTIESSYIGSGVYYIDENGNIYCNHDYQESYRNESTCQQQGEICYRCINCHDSIYELLEAVDHCYDASGSCIWCGMNDGETTDIEAYRSEITSTILNEWSLIRKEFDISDYMKAYSEIRTNLKNASSVYEISEVYASFQSLLEDVRATAPKICNHNYSEIGRVEPTCTVEGYTELQCTSCGEITTESLGFAEHMDEDGDGYCDNCNAELGSNEELENYRNDIINRMHDEWKMLTSEYSISAEQQEMFDNYIYRAENAVSIDELDVIFHKEYMLFVNDIRNSLPQKDYIIRVEYMGNLPDFTVGSDISEYLLNYVVGTVFEIEMSSGAVYTIVVTEDMVTASGDTNEVGSYINIDIRFTFNDSDSSHGFSVQVVPNVESANLIGSYSANCIYNYMEGLDVTISLYDNGYATMSLAFGGEDQGTQYVTYTLENGIFTMIIDGGAALLCLDAEKGEFTTYIPEGNLIGTYTYADGDEIATFDVYGEYTGAKEYLAVFKMSSDEMGATITGYVYLDLENKLFNTYMFEDSNFSIDESGNLYCDHNYIEQYRNEATCQHEGQICYRCTNCREGIYETIPVTDHNYDEYGNCVYCYINDGTGENIESYRSNIINMMHNEWNAVTSQYNVQPMYHDMFNDYIYRAENAVSIGELDAIFQKEFMLFINDVRNSASVNEYVTNVVLVSEELEFTEGGDVYEFLQTNVVGKRLIVYMSSGIVHEIKITSDMLSWDGNSTTFGGRIYIYINYNLNGMDYNYSFSVRVGMDMADVALLGTYNANCMYNYMDGVEITISLYDNGYARMCAVINGEEMSEEYVTYVIEGDKLTMFQEDQLIIYRLNEESMELSVYTPDGDIIGSYTYTQGSMSADITVYGEYAGAGEYFAVVNFGDDEMSITVTANVYLDLENRTIVCWVIGERTLDIDELGNIYCNHVYVEDICEPTCTESGWKKVQCEKCGTGSHQHIAPLGHEYSADGICTRCGDGDIGIPDMPGCEHNYKEVGYQAPDCMNVGYRELQCDVCGIYIRESLGYTEHIDANGDAVCDVCYVMIGGENVESPSTPADCAHMDQDCDGYCNYCKIEMLGEANPENPDGVCSHEYVVEVRDASCTEAGLEIHTCGLCGNVFTIEREPFGHAYDENGVCVNCGGDVVIPDYSYNGNDSNANYNDINNYADASTSVIAA